ncbi:Centrosomal spindle body, CEP44-domain-containing protein [Gaertneriomyces semiglobifer]|nr:Centrosomal spindle body, CEP44-domain-containing protein [Gaertneriomyces semiglobifer]
MGLLMFLGKLTHGSPGTFLPLLHFILLDYSPFLSRYFHKKGYELYGRKDDRFLESVYKLLRDECGYKPSLTQPQFFSVGFSERKMMMLVDVIKMVKEMDKTKRTLNNKVPSNEAPNKVHQVNHGITQPNGKHGAFKKSTRDAVSPTQACAVRAQLPTATLLSSTAAFRMLSDTVAIVPDAYSYQPEQIASFHQHNRSHLLSSSQQRRTQGSAATREAPAPLHTQQDAISQTIDLDTHPQDAAFVSLSASEIARPDASVHRHMKSMRKYEEHRYASTHESFLRENVPDLAALEGSTGIFDDRLHVQSFGITEGMTPIPKSAEDDEAEGGGADATFIVEDVKITEIGQHQPQPSTQATVQMPPPPARTPPIPTAPDPSQLSPLAPIAGTRAAVALYPSPPPAAQPPSHPALLSTTTEDMRVFYERGILPHLTAHDAELKGLRMRVMELENEILVLRKAMPHANQSANINSADKTTAIATGAQPLNQVPQAPISIPIPTPLAQPQPSAPPERDLPPPSNAPDGSNENNVAPAGATAIAGSRTAYDYIQGIRSRMRETEELLTSRRRRKVPLEQQ